MTKIHLIRYIVLITLIIFPITSESNATPEGAQQFIKHVSDKALKLIKDQKSNEIMKEQQLSKLFEESVDTRWIAKFAMGSHWRKASKAQKEVYMKLYKRFLINSYVPKFKEYTNQRVIFKNFFDEGDSEYLIETKIVQDGGPSIRVDYKVRKNGNGKYHIFDVVAEGVSLITTQRSEFASILSRKGVDYLIKRLKSKV